MYSQSEEQEGVIGYLSSYLRNLHNFYRLRDFEYSWKGSQIEKQNTNAQYTKINLAKVSQRTAMFDVKSFEVDTSDYSDCMYRGGESYGTVLKYMIIGEL